MTTTPRQLESDDALARAARDGDEAAFALLMARHRPMVCRLIEAAIRDGEQAEDLAQETFVRVHRHLGDYAARDQFVPYLKRIALNLARNFLRDRLCTQTRSEAIARETTRELSREDRQTDPAAILESRLLRREVRAALERLRPELREVVVLYYFAGQGVPEVARAAGIPEGTVKSRLYHARRQIQQLLDGAQTTTGKGLAER